MHKALVVAAAILLCGCATLSSRQPSSLPEQQSWRRIAEPVPVSYDFLPDAKLGYYVPTARGPRDAHYWYLRDYGPGYGVLADDSEARVARDDAEKRPGEALHGQGCGPGMVRVTGKMRPWEVVMKLQDRACLDGGGWTPTKLCRRYDAAKLDYDGYVAKLPEAERKRLAPKPLDFCIDRYEFPNIPGENPAIMVNYLDARALCESRGKRLCDEDEWVFACEGEKGLPYPYGYERDNEACNIDKVPTASFDADVLMSRNESAVAEQLSALWMGEPSGSRPGCVSPFGVHDMTGNVDEWSTWSSGGRPKDHGGAGGRKPINRGQGYPSMLKGGFWTKIRGRCQPSTSSHEPQFYFYQQGFRCCSNPQ